MSLRRDATRNEARGMLALPPPPLSGATQRRTRARAARTPLPSEPRESRAGDSNAAEAPPTVVPAVEVPRAYQPRRAARSPSPRKTQVPETERPTNVESAPKESRTAATAVGRRGRDRNRRLRRPQTAPPAKTQPAPRQRSRSRDKTQETRERSLSAKRKSDEQMSLIAVHRFYPDQQDDDDHSDELVTYSFLAAVNQEGRPALPLKLIWNEHEWSTTAILDTGATISVISQEALMEFNDFLKNRNNGRTPRKGFVPLVSIPKIEVAGPFGHRTPLSGYRVDLNMRLAEHGGKTVRVGQTCFVARRLTRPLILGTDFMRDYLAIIAFDMNTTKSSLALTFFGSAVTTVDRGPDRPPEDVVNYEKVENGPDTAKKSAPRKPADSPPNVVREEAEARPRASVSPRSNDVAAPSAKKRKTLKDLLGRHARLLDGSLGRVDGYRHKIAMRNTRPRKPKNFPVPMKYRDEVKRQLVEMERLGVVRKDATEYVNPLVVVKKNNGKIRLCLDARAINETTTDDHAQPLTIEEVLARIGDRRVYSKIDINQAYWQIELEPESRKYTGFMFEGQTYVFLRMPFGLKTAGASFTRALDLAVARVPQLRPNLTVYLDDILLASDTYEQHFEQLELLFEALERIGVRLNKDKCEFLANKVQFLGHDLSRTTVEMTDETKRAIAAFKRPRTKKELQSFLGLVNWDRRFVPRLSDWTRSLEDMLRKNVKFHWTEERTASFDAIKNAFRDAEILFLIRNDLPYGLETDASLVGLGARLYQFDAERPDRQYTVAYASRSLKPAERNYTTTEQEGLALAWALNKFKLVLMGRTVHVKTDHRALTFLQSCAMNSRRIARWIEFFGHFDLRIQHIPGRSNAVADLLSRNPAPTSTEQPAKFERAGETSSVQEELALVEIDPYDEIDPAEWVEWLRRSQREDATLGRLVVEHPDRYNRRDDLVRRKKDDGTTDRIVVPEAAAWKLLDKVHRHLVHFGTDKVIDFASRYFTIDNLDRIARDVVGSCEICLATKYYTRASVGAQYYDQPTETGQMVSVDLFGPLPKSYKGHKYVLVLLDLFSKHTALFPIRNQKVESIVQAIEHQYVPRRGYTPETILTDCGGQFVTARWKQFARRVGTALRRTAPYNPQANPVERVMRELGRVLRAYAHHDHESWDAVVPRVEDVLNRTAHASTGQPPNALERDDRWIREAPRGDDRMRPRTFPRVFLPKNLRVDRLVEHDETDRDDRVERARRRLTQAARKRRTQADKKEVARPFAPGDYVWRKRQRRSDALHRKSKKLYPIYEGPLIIRECPHPNTYVLEWPDGRHAGVANSRVLRPHREPRLKEPSEASDTSGNDSSDGASSDPESDRREESTPTTDASEEGDSSDNESTDRDSRDEEEASSEDSEEYSPEEEEDEEESDPEDLAMFEHPPRLADRELRDPRYRPERPRERTEPLIVSHSLPKRRRRRNRRRRGNRRPRRRGVTSTSYRGEYDDYEEPEDDRREDDDLRLEKFDEDDSDLYTGEYTAYEVAMELHRRYEERERAYQRSFELWSRRPGEHRSNDPPDEDTRWTSRAEERIPLSLYDRSYRARDYNDDEDRYYRRHGSRDYVSAEDTGYIYDRRKIRDASEKIDDRPRASPYAYRAEDLTCRWEQRGSPPTRSADTASLERASPPPTQRVAHGGANGSLTSVTSSREQDSDATKRKRVRTRGKSRKKKNTPKKPRSLRTFSSPPDLDTIEEEEEDSTESDEEDEVPPPREELPSLPSPPNSGKIEKIASEVTGGLSMIDYLRSLYQEDQVLQETTPSESAIGDASEVCAQIAALDIETIKPPRARRPIRRLSRHKKYRELVRDNTVTSPTREFRWQQCDEKTPEALASLGLVRVYRGSARTDAITPKKKESSSEGSSPVKVDESPPPSHQSFSDYWTTGAEFAPAPIPDRENSSPPSETPPYTLADYERDFKSRGRAYVRSAGPLFNGTEQQRSTVRTFTEEDFGSRLDLSIADRPRGYGLVAQQYPKPSVTSSNMAAPQENNPGSLTANKIATNGRAPSRNAEDIFEHIRRLGERRLEAFQEQVCAFRGLARQVEIITEEIEDVQRVTYLINFIAKELALLGTPVQVLTQEEKQDPRYRMPLVATLSSAVDDLPVLLPFRLSRQHALNAFKTPFDMEMNPMVPDHPMLRTLPVDDAESTRDNEPSSNERTSGVVESIRESDQMAADFSTRAVRASPAPTDVITPDRENTTRKSPEIVVDDEDDRRQQQLQSVEKPPRVEKAPECPVAETANKAPTTAGGEKEKTYRVEAEKPLAPRSPPAGTSLSPKAAPVVKTTDKTPQTGVQSKKRKRVRPPRTTGSRRAEKFATPTDALARKRDPATGKFLKTSSAAKKRGNKRKRIVFSFSSDGEDDDVVRTPKTTDLSKVKSLIAKRIRLHSDEVGKPIATSTPNAPPPKDEPKETRRDIAKRQMPTVREEVELRPSMKVVIRPSTSDQSESTRRPIISETESSSEEENPEATPQATTPPRKDVTGADTVRDSPLRAELSRSTPVGGGQRAPGVPDVDTTEPQCPGEHSERVTNGAAPNSSITVKYPGTDVECVVSIEKMLQFLDQQGALPQREEN